jgi:hypothetical protein
LYKPQTLAGQFHPATGPSSIISRSSSDLRLFVFFAPDLVGETTGSGFFVFCSSGAGAEGA